MLIVFDSAFVSFPCGRPAFLAPEMVISTECPNAHVKWAVCQEIFLGHISKISAPPRSLGWKLLRLVHTSVWIVENHPRITVNDTLYKIVCHYHFSTGVKIKPEKNRGLVLWCEKCNFNKSIGHIYGNKSLTWGTQSNVLCQNKNWLKNFSDLYMNID